MENTNTVTNKLQTGLHMKIQTTVYNTVVESEFTILIPIPFTYTHKATSLGIHISTNNNWYSITHTHPLSTFRPNTAISIPHS